MRHTCHETSPPRVGRRRAALPTCSVPPAPPYSTHEPSLKANATWSTSAPQCTRTWCTPRRQPNARVTLSVNLDWHAGRPIAPDLHHPRRRPIQRRQRRRRRRLGSKPPIGQWGRIRSSAGKRQEPPQVASWPDRAVRPAPAWRSSPGRNLLAALQEVVCAGRARDGGETCPAHTVIRRRGRMAARLVCWPGSLI
jgi:hypothetical protein